MRVLIGTAVVIAMLVVDATASVGEPTPDPVAACQAAFARASRRLADTIRFKVGRCIAAGSRCLAGTKTDSSACCAAAAFRCRAQKAKLTRAARRFADNVASGRCAHIEFGTVLDPTGLGYESAVQTCTCLPTSTDVTDLRSLGVCVGRLVDTE